MSWRRALTRFSASTAKPRTRAPKPSLFFTTSYLSTDTSASAPLGLAPTRSGVEKPRVVVLGTGWAGCRLMKGIDTSVYDVVCVSPRNHMVFTPLLASTCVGTLEFRSVAEPIARIQPAISRAPGSYFFLARCKDIDLDSRTVLCETVTDGDDADTLEPWSFKVAYDKLVIAAGAEASTFGIRGVKEHAIFLREVHHAQEIRRKLLLNLMLSDVPAWISANVVEVMSNGSTLLPSTIISYVPQETEAEFTPECHINLLLELSGVTMFGVPQPVDTMTLTERPVECVISETVTGTSDSTEGLSAISASRAEEISQRNESISSAISGSQMGINGAIVVQKALDFSVTQIDIDIADS